MLSKTFSGLSDHILGDEFVSLKEVVEGHGAILLVLRLTKLLALLDQFVDKVEKLKADDHFFNETGIEEEDVEPSIKRLDLENDEEFKKIIDEYKVKSDEFLASKKDETAAFMRKAQAAAMMMEARKKAAQDGAAEDVAAADDGDAADDDGDE